jgi:hypothetical protein
VAASAKASCGISSINEPKDESVCNNLLATDGEDGDGVERKCAKVIKGKNPANLKMHLEAAHDIKHKQMRF